MTIQSNLLVETLDFIKNEIPAKACLDVHDIKYIGSTRTGHTCTFNEFKLLADRNYNRGVGHCEVASDLVIVFEDTSRIIREPQEDGSESWSYRPPLVAAYVHKPIQTLFVTEDDYHNHTLAGINGHLN